VIGVGGVGSVGVGVVSGGTTTTTFGGAACVGGAVCRGGALCVGCGFGKAAARTTAFGFGFGVGVGVGFVVAINVRRGVTPDAACEGGAE
jgi:hypothetical protein